MTKHLKIPYMILAFGAVAHAGPDVYAPLDPASPAVATSGFANARRPISNPTLFDLALPRSEVHAFFIHHRFPDRVNSAIGPVDAGGDLNLFAIQLELAITDRFSLVASKDGYIDLNPDNSFSSDEGFANIAAGAKYAFIYDPAKQLVVSGTATIELPTGDDGVLQGEGDGLLNLIVSHLKLHQQWQIASAAGVQVPFDNEMSTQGFVSAHVSYEVSPWFIPLVEVNWLRVLDGGDGSPARFGGIPSIAVFEGADVINWGAAAADDSDYVTLALGFRSRLCEGIDMGVAYEFPLTDEEENLTEDRFTVDATFAF